jgi:hypothetical protein
MDWKQRLENRHTEEFGELVKRPQSDLLDMLNDGNYRVLGSLLKALSLHGSIKDIGWPLYNAIVREENDSNRVACARALIESMCSIKLKVQPFQFLEKTDEYASNLEALRNELIRKIGAENE